MLLVEILKWSKDLCLPVLQKVVKYTRNISLVRGNFITIFHVFTNEIQSLVHLQDLITTLAGTISYKHYVPACQSRD